MNRRGFRISAGASLLFGAALSVFLAGSAAAEDTVRSLRIDLAAADLGHLAVENLVGTMRVVRTSDAAAVAIATVHAESAAQAEGFRFERVSSDSGTTALRVRYPSGIHTLRYRRPGDDGYDGFWSFDFSGSRYDYDGRTYRVSRSHGTAAWADVEVRLPAGAIGARFRNLAGLLEARGLDGHLQFEVESADLDLERLNGEISLDGSSGDTRAHEIRGTWRSRFSSGDLELQGFEGESLMLHTSSGDIAARDVKARRTTIETSSGDVAIRGGEIEELSARSSSGDISLEAPGGRLRDVRAHTSSGDVTLRLAREASFEAEADQSSGDMEVGFSDGSAVLRHHRLVGYRRGDGALKIRVETSSGDFRIAPL